MGYLQQGIYNDYNANWFTDVGFLIIESVLIIIIMPPLEFIAKYFLRQVLKAYD